MLSCKYCISIHHIKGYMITQDVVGYDHNQRALSSLGDTESEVCSLPLLTVTPSPPVHNIRQHMKNTWNPDSSAIQRFKRPYSAACIVPESAGLSVTEASLRRRSNSQVWPVLSQPVVMQWVPVAGSLPGEARHTGDTRDVIMAGEASLSRVTSLLKFWLLK